MDMMHTQVFAVAPEAPSVLTRQPNTLEMSWNDNSIGETGFTIHRATDAGFTQNLMNFEIGPSVTKFTDTTTALSTTYYYRMQAINLVGDTAVYAAPAIGFPKTFANSTFSNTITLTTPDIAAPTNLQASLNANPTRITLTWVDASNNEARFAIWRSENGGTPIQIGTVTRSAAQSLAIGGTVTFSNRNTATAPLTPGNTYTYYVTGVNVGGSSFNSNTATVYFTVPAAPSDLAGSAVRIPRNTIQDRVTLTWTSNSNNENGFEIQRATAVAFTSPSVFTVGAGVTSFSQNVRRPSDYYYRVRATNTAGSSAWSNVVLVVAP
jgi:hypothetical protein